MFKICTDRANKNRKQDNLDCYSYPTTLYR